LIQEYEQAIIDENIVGDSMVDDRFDYTVPGHAASDA
jgi:hypothetical protein